MKLTKEQLDQLGDIFRAEVDFDSYAWGHDAPTATFPAVVEIVESFLDTLDQPPDNSKPGETPDEYLARLVREASPAWEGVDPEKFMDEVRGRVPFDQAVSLLRDLADLQNGPPLETYRERWEVVMSDIHEFLHEHETSTDE